MLMKRVCCIVIILILAGLAAFSVSIAENEKTLEYYFLNACEHCSPEDDFAALFQRLTGQPLGSKEVRFHNVYQERGRKAYEAATAGWTEAEKQLPLLIMGDEHYAGETSVEEGLQTQFGVKEKDTRSRVYFLTSTACDSCLKARAVVDAHPAIVPLETDGRVYSSEVSVMEVNVNADPAMAMALLKLYRVEDERRITPMILMGPDTVLAGEREITENFLSLLKTGAALNTPAAEPDSTMNTADALTLAGAAAAGVTGGLNPCALSMLLVFVGVLLSGHKGVLRNGLLYLAGKLALYLLIGLAFAELWIQIAPEGLPLAVRILATAIGVTVIVLNLMDAASARREAYGDIRNQLPASLRGRLRRRIKQAAESRWIGLSAVMLGMLVGAGEFMCAGQLYLGVLISNARNGSVVPIVTYCLAFLLPSLAVLCFIASGRRAAESADWVLRHMAVIKIITAFVMAAVLVFMWIGR